MAPGLPSSRRSASSSTSPVSRARTCAATATFAKPRASSSTPRSAPSRLRQDPSSTYAPEFVVRYDAGGSETYSVATPPSTQLSVGWIGSSQKSIERMAIGSTVPCWLDPTNVKTVMLDRGPQGAYFFALLPLLVLALAGWMLTKALRAPKSSRALNSAR